MNSSTSSKSGLFLMELIIAILFFSLSAVICVQLFVKSHITSDESVELNHAVEWCQNVAEAFYGCDGNPEEMMKLFENSYVGNADEAKNTFYLNFNEDFQPTAESGEMSTYISADHAYKLSVNVHKEGEMLLCDISAYSFSTSGKTKDIYQLQIQLFTGKETSHE